MVGSGRVPPRVLVALLVAEVDQGAQAVEHQQVVAQMPCRARVPVDSLRLRTIWVRSRPASVGKVVSNHRLWISLTKWRSTGRGVSEVARASNQRRTSSPLCWISSAVASGSWSNSAEASNAPGTTRWSRLLRGQREVAVGASRLGLRLGRLSEPHRGQRRLLDLTRGEFQDRSAVRLEPAPTVLGKAIQGVAVVTHVPRVFRWAAATFNERGQPSLVVLWASSIEPCAARLNS